MRSRRSRPSATGRPGHERDHRSAGPSTGPTPTSASRCRGPTPRSWWRAAASTSTTSCCRAWCTSPSCAARTRTRKIVSDRRRRGAADAGRAARVHGRRPRAALRPVGGDAGAPQGHEVGAAACPCRSSARPGSARRWPRWWPRPAPSPRMRVAKRRRRLRAAAGRGRHGDRAGARHARDPPRARRQPLLPARQRERQGRRRLRRRAQGRRGHLPHRPPHGRDARAALDPGRLQPRVAPSSPSITPPRRRT